MARRPGSLRIRPSPFQKRLSEISKMESEANANSPRVGIVGEGSVRAARTPTSVRQTARQQANLKENGDVIGSDKGNEPEMENLGELLQEAQWRLIKERVQATEEEPDTAVDTRPDVEWLGGADGLVDIAENKVTLDTKIQFTNGIPVLPADSHIFGRRSPLESKGGKVIPEEELRVFKAIKQLRRKDEDCQQPLDWEKWFPAFEAEISSKGI